MTANIIGAMGRKRTFFFRPLQKGNFVILVQCQQHSTVTVHHHCASNYAIKQINKKMHTHTHPNEIKRKSLLTELLRYALKSIRITSRASITLDESFVPL